MIKVDSHWTEIDIDKGIYCKRRHLQLCPNFALVYLGTNTVLSLVSTSTLRLLSDCSFHSFNLFLADSSMKMIIIIPKLRDKMI